MEPGIYIVLAIIVLLIIIVISNIKIVPQAQLLKATTTHNRNTSYKYSARTLVMKDNRVFKDIQSDY